MTEEEVKDDIKEVKKEERPSFLKEARAEREEMNKLLEEIKKEKEEWRELRAEEILSGKAPASKPEVKIEEDPREYLEKVMGRKRK